MKKTLQLIILLLSFCSAVTFGQNKNVILRSHLTFPGKQLSNIWGYTANGKEYALVGTSTGISIVDITDPNNPALLHDIPGPNSIWREIRTWQHYAYVTTEGGGGLQIIDLSSLPSAPAYKSWTGDSIITSKLAAIHSLHIDNKGYIYLHGGGYASGATKIASLKDPWNPHFLGIYTAPVTGNGVYVHDGFVRNDTLWAAHVYTGNFSVVDVRNKANPVLLATQETPNKFTHNTWLSDNGKVLFTTDETDNSFLTSYDVSDLSDIKELDRIQSNPGSNSVVHNTYFRNNYAISSWYKDGFVITDAIRPDNLCNIGNYDTSPLSGSGMKGCWGVYGFFPSGNIVASDIEEGLYVLTPKYIRACYLEGNVTDSMTSLPVSNALVEINSTTQEYAKISGTYKTSIVDSGLYDVKYSKTGYRTKITRNVRLKNGILAIQNIKLNPGTGIDTVDADVQYTSDITPEAAPTIIKNLGVKAYPNPFKNDILIKYFLTSAPSEIVIHDILGNVVESKAIYSNEGEERVGKNLRSGIYFVSVNGGKGSNNSVIKIIKY